MDLQKLRSFMSVLQAQNTSVVFNTTHVNPSPRARWPADDDYVRRVESKARELFPQEWRAYSCDPYRLDNLSTYLLTRRVIVELAEQTDKEVVVLTNGCCNSRDCPTTVFYAAVVRAIALQT